MNASHVSTFYSFKIPLSRLGDMSLQRPGVFGGPLTRLRSLTDAVVEVISGFPLGY